MVVFIALENGAGPTALACDIVWFDYGVIRREKTGMQSSTNGLTNACLRTECKRLRLPQA